jgi:IS30 family transposase
LIEHIKEKLSRKWSFDAITGRLRFEGEETVCTKTVYNWLNSGYIKGYNSPPKKGRGNQSRVGRHNSTVRRIDERPLEATSLRSLGDGFSVIGLWRVIEEAVVCWY